jgi:hypothetical protein
LSAPIRAATVEGMQRVVVVVTLAVAACAVGCTPKAGTVRPDHPWLRDETGRIGLAPATSASPLFDDAVPSDDDATLAARERIARAAGNAVGGGPIVVGNERFRMDCSGVARGIYAKANVPLGFVKVDGGQNDTHVLFELVRQNGSLRRHDPLPGDLVFFDDTWDENGNALVDDPLSHVGVVEKVERDGTVVFVHRIGARIVRARLNLERPHDRYDDDGHALNHYLRAAHGSTPAKTTGELFVAFGSLPVSEPARLASN